MARKPGKPKNAGTSKESIAMRRKKFIEAYIANGGNGTEAVKTAGYTHKTARQQASRLLSDANIKAQLSERAKETARKYELTTDLAVRSIYQEITFDPAKLYREDGSLRDITELDEDTRMALTAVEFEQIGKREPVMVRKVKWAARHQAREQLMKHLGMFERDNEQKTKGLAELLKAVDGKTRGLPESEEGEDEC
jgi:phage terminase small subunit